MIRTICGAATKKRIRKDRWLINTEPTTPSETSVEILYNETRDLLLRQLDGIEQTDTKAGIVAGFAGLIVTAGLSILPDFPNLSSHTTDPTLLQIFLFSIVAAFAMTLLSFALALWSYRIRSYKEVLKPRTGYEKWMGQSASDTRLKLLHNLIDSYEKNEKIINNKTSLIQWSMCALFFALFFYVVAAAALVRVILF